MSARCWPAWTGWSTGTSWCRSPCGDGGARAAGRDHPRAPPRALVARRAPGPGVPVSGTLNAMTAPEPRDPLRHIELTRTGPGSYQATNRRGGVLPVGSGDDADFTPVELLLAALAGCSAIDVDLITGKRAEAIELRVTAEGDKIRDEHGNRLDDLRLRFQVVFPEGEGGDRAREVLPRAIAQSRDRLCTVGRTVQGGGPIRYEVD